MRKSRTGNTVGNMFCGEEEKYQIHFSLADDVIYTVDTCLRITSISPNIKSLLGYEPGDIIGKAFPELNLLDPEDMKRAIADTGRLFSGEKISSATYRFLTKDRSVRFGEIKGEPVEKNGRILGFIAVARDVTERKGIERALRESEERFRLIADNARDVIWIRDLELKCLYTSPSTRNLRGYSVEEAMSQSFEEILTPESFRTAISAFEHECRFVLDGQRHDPDWSATLELEVVCKDGSHIITENIISLLYDQNRRIVGILGITRNVTERKRMEEALKESERRYRLLAENARDVIWVLDENLNYLYISPSVKELRGYTSEEAMKMPLDRVLTPESYRKAITLFQEGLELEKSGMIHGRDWSTTLDLELICKNGSTVWTELMVTIIYDDQGKAVGLLGITRDISERVRVEEELKRYRRHLEELVKERTAELVKANECLQSEIEERKKSEEALKAREMELQERQKALEEMNIALKVLLKQRNEDREEIEKKLIANINTSFQLYLDKLKSTGLKEEQSRFVSEMEMHLKKIRSSFIRDLSSECLGLSPSEIKVATLIKEGKSSKEIADLLNISVNTVLFHRNNIRSKVGVKNNKVNLISFFQSFEKNELP